jgi:actin-related protein 6
MKAKSERRRPFIGNQIEECRDISGLYYILSFQKGYLINWDIQKSVWDHMFTSDSNNIVNLSETPTIVTEPIFNFASLKDAMIEIFFEEYDCHSLLHVTAAELAASNYSYQCTKPKNAKKPLCCVVVDTGYSFTHIVPFIKGVMVKEAIRRVDIGGKLLTNHLKEIISYRQLNVMDESYVINQAKEDSCFVAENFNEAMKQTKKRYPENKIVRDYYLPDFTSLRRG